MMHDKQLSNPNLDEVTLALNESRDFLSFLSLIVHVFYVRGIGIGLLNAFRCSEHKVVWVFVDRRVSPRKNYQNSFGMLFKRLFKGLSRPFPKLSYDSIQIECFVIMNIIDGVEAYWKAASVLLLFTRYSISYKFADLGCVENQVEGRLSDGMFSKISTAWI